MRLRHGMALLCWTCATVVAAYAHGDTTIKPGVAHVPNVPFVDPAVIEPSLARALRGSSGFCTGEDYEITPEDLPLCNIAEEIKDRCPGFAGACSRLRGSVELQTEPLQSPLLQSLGTVLTTVFWGALAAGLVLLLKSLVKWLLGRQREPSRIEESAISTPARLETPAHPPKDVAPEVLLIRARALAEQGAFREAMAGALAALLRALEIRGALEQHPSRTNGEYLHKLAPQPAIASEFRKVVESVEVVEFGGAPASSERWRAVLERVMRLVNAGAVVIVALLPSLLFGCSASDEGRHVCGSGASGYAVLCEVLSARGAAVQKRYREMKPTDLGVDTVIVVDDVLDKQRRAALSAWAAAGGRLVIADAFEDYLKSKSVRRATARCNVDLRVPGSAGSTAEHARSRYWLPRAITFEPAKGQSVLVTCGDNPFVLRTDVGAGVIIAVADSRLLTNAALAIERNAALAAALVAPPESTIRLIGPWTQGSSELPTSAVYRSGLLPWLIHVFVLGLALALYYGAPFGPRRNPEVRHRRAFVEHVVALGGSYARARASRIALMHYGHWALERLRMRTASNSQTRLIELASTVASRLSMKEHDVMRLIVAVRSAVDDEHDSSTEVEHLAVLRGLSQLVRKAGKAR